MGPLSQKCLSGLLGLRYSGEQVGETGSHAGTCPVIGGEVRRRPTIRIANSAIVVAVLVSRGFERFRLLVYFIRSEFLLPVLATAVRNATIFTCSGHILSTQAVARNKWTGSMKHVFAFEFFRN